MRTDERTNERAWRIHNTFYIRMYAKIHKNAPKVVIHEERCNTLTLQVQKPSTCGVPKFRESGGEHTLIFVDQYDAPEQNGALPHFLLAFHYLCAQPKQEKTAKLCLKAIRIYIFHFPRLDEKFLLRCMDQSHTIQSFIIIKIFHFTPAYLEPFDHQRGGRLTFRSFRYDTVINKI